MIVLDSYDSSYKITRMDAGIRSEVLKRPFQYFKGIKIHGCIFIPHP